MHPAFEIFTEETRRKVAEMFSDTDNKDRGRPFTSRVGDAEDTRTCCPIGLCLLLDGYLKPTNVDHHSRSHPNEIITYVDAEGRVRYPVAPSARTIVNIVAAAWTGDRGYPDRYEMDLLSFYTKWDRGDLPISSLPSHLGVEEG